MNAHSATPAFAWFVASPRCQPARVLERRSAPDGAAAVSVAGVSLTGHLRLDNRQELAAALGLPPTLGDAALVCHAYLRLGDAFAARLLGDFGFALHDQRNHCLLLVRDHLGVAPLYYHLGAESCLASDSLDAILARPGVADTLDEGVVAEWCANGRVYNQRDTFYAQIKKCPRASVLRITPEAVHASGYWNLRDIPPLREACEQDHVEHLRSLLNRVIADRLDPRAPMGAHSSGGLDSTPIAIMAGRLCRQHGTPFHTYNWCKPDDPREADCHEWSDARRVAQAEGFVHHEFGIDAATRKQSLLHHDIRRDGSAMFEYEAAVLAQARQDGVHHLFSGFGGDEGLTSRSRDSHLPAVRDGHFLDALRRLIQEADPGENWRTLKLVKRYLQLLRAAWQSDTVRNRRSHHEEQQRLQRKLTLIAPDFVRQATAGFRPYALIGALSITEKQCLALESGYHQERIESWAILGRRAGVRYLYPYLDKRIVEFALSLPPESFFRHGRDRHLYRQALHGVLPDFIATKRKLPESYRVRQLARASWQAFADPEVLQKIAATASPFVDTGALLQQCTDIARRSSAAREEVQGSTALSTAILALNLQAGGSAAGAGQERA